MDEIVFNDIYDQYVNPVWRTALYYSGNQTDAEEITQLIVGTGVYSGTAGSAEE